MNVTGEATNPYIGPRPFRTGDTLYGRDWETQELRDLLIARRFVLLHSPSGAGKTSLIQAGLIPALEAEGFRILPTIRVGMNPPPDVLAMGCPFNRFVLSAHISLGGLLTQPDGSTPNITDLCASTLDALLDRVLGTDGDAAPLSSEGETRSVLIFDQFEEILTVDPLNLDAKKVFFEQLGEALKDRDRWVLFALREDYVAALESYLTDIPTRLSTHFRLEPLRKDAALEAIKQPVQALDCDYAEGVAETLVDDLLTVPLGKSEFIEPVQLQVVCYDLWKYWRDHTPPTARTITQAHLTAFGNVDQALANFYDTCIQTTTRQTGISEHRLRDWFDHQLITPAKTRGIVYKDRYETAGIPNSAVNELDRLHIVHIEPRAGADWVELTHDGFIEPITEANLAWEKRELDRTRARLRRALLIGAVALGLLVMGLGLLSYLRGQATTQARRDTADVQATGTALVEAQIKTQAEAEREALYSALQARQAQSMSLVTDAQVALQNNDASLALTLALDAYRLNPDLPDVQRILADAAYAPGPRSYLSTGAMTTLYSRLAISPDERFVVVAPGMVSTASQPMQQQVAPATQNNPLIIWDLDTQSVVRQLEGLTGQVVAVDYALGPGDARILAASQTAIMVWDAATGDPLWSFDLTQTRELAKAYLTSAVLAPDSSIALVGGCGRQDVYGTCKRGILLVFNLNTLSLQRTINVDATSSVTAVGFEPGGLVALVATGQGQVARCSLVSTAPHSDSACLAHTQVTTAAETTGDPPGISVMITDQARAQALLGTQDGRLLVWDMHTLQVVQYLSGGHTGVVRGVDFGKAGEQTALSVGEDGQMIWWNLAAGTPTRRFTFKETVMWDVAYRQTGESAITAMSDNSVIWWDLAQGDQKRVIDTLAPITTLDFAADGSTLLAGYADGQVKYWEISGISPATFNAGQNAVTILAANPNPADSLVITQAAANTLQIWRNGLPSPLTIGLQEVTDIAFSPDRQMFVASGCQTLQVLTRTCRVGRLVLVDANTFTVLQTLEGNTYSATAEVADTAEHLRHTSSVAFSPDGHIVVSGSTAGTLLTWDITSGQAATAAPQALAVTINDLAIMPHTESTRVLVGGCLTRESTSQLCSMGAVILWDMATGQVGNPLEVRGAEITRVAISPDGQSLLAGGSDGAISRWDTTTGALIFRYLGHAGSITGLAFPPGEATGSEAAGGEWFVSSASDGTIIQWRLDSTDSLLNWTERNRYSARLDCSEQQQYYQTTIDPACLIVSAAVQMENIAATRPPTATVPQTLPAMQSTAEPSLNPPTRSPTPTPVPQMILIGDVQTLLAAGAPQYWSFEGTAGDLLSITLATEAERAEGSIILYSPDGRELAFASSTKIEKTVLINGLALPQTGLYTLVTQEFGAQGTPYTLTLTSLRATTPTPRPSSTPDPSAK